MSWCVDHGIAYSQFLAWSPADVELVRATLINRALECPDCHVREDEWGDRRPDGVIVPRRPVAFVAKTHECLICKVADQRVAKEKNGLGPGVKVQVMRRGGV